jgi:hypothetical protein
VSKVGGVPKIDHARNLIDEGESRQCVVDLLNVGRVTLPVSARLDDGC